MNTNPTVDTKMTSPNTAQHVLLGRALREAVETGQAECVEVLLPLCTVEQIEDAAGLCITSNNMECLVAVLPHCDPKNSDSLLLRQAAKFGRNEIMELLLPISDPTGNNSQALRLAAVNGHIQCVELLIPVSNPKANDSYALPLAASRGYADCVRALIPVSNPKANDSYALQLAVYNGYSQCVELLYPTSDPVVALENLQKEHPNDYSVWGKLEQMIEAGRLNTVLHKEVGATTAVKVHRKM